MRSGGRFGAVSLAATSLLGLGALALPAAADSGAPLPTAKNVFKQAVAKVRAKPKFSHAVMLEVDGTTKNGQAVKHARGIVKVRFVFDNQGTANAPFASAFVHYGPPPKRFGKVHGVKEPFLEDKPIPHPPKMSVERAVKLLRRAGFHQRFRFVTLRKPVARQKTHPLYFFGLGKQGNQKFVTVDTVTKEVHPVS